MSASHRHHRHGKKMGACEPWLVFLVLLSTFVASVKPCTNGQLSPDPSNCANYLQCDHDQELTRPCPEGLLFNPAISTCDWPANVNCAAGGGDDGSSSTSSTTTLTPYTSEASAVVASTSGSDPSCCSPATTSTAASVVTTTTDVLPPPSPPPPFPVDASAKSPRFAPYFDVNLGGTTLTQIYSKTGQKDYTLAFALGSSEGCKPKWGAQVDINDPSVIGPIRELQAVGGHFIVATGGAMGPYFEHLCSSVDDLANAYKIVMDAVGTNHVDVDIESTVDADRVNQALAKVQRERPNTTVSYTLMVQAEDYGLTPILGVNILENAKKNGVRVTIVNPMTMEFGGPSPDFGDSVINAAKSVLVQMKQIWQEKSDQELKGMLGVTPMIGRNFNGKTFQLEHAQKLVSWANANHIGLLAFWSVGRDNGGCAGGGVSPTCSSIAQSEYQFTKIFQQFTG